MEQLKPDVAEFTRQRDTGAAGTRQHLTSVSPRLSAHRSPPSCCVNVNVRGGRGARDTGQGRMGLGPVSRSQGMPECAVVTLAICPLLALLWGLDPEPGKLLSLSPSPAAPKHQHPSCGSEGRSHFGLFTA